MDYALILDNVRRFIDLNEAEEALYTSLLKERKLKKKEFLLQEGELVKYNYFITEGCLKTFKIDDNGTEHISMFSIKDWWSGDLANFITQQPATCFIQALEDSTVLQMSRENYDLLFEEIPKFERFYRILYQRSLVSYIQQSDQNISLNAEDRYLNFIKKYPTLLNRISQKNIAAYLGVTPEFLSVLRKKMAS